MAPLLDRHRARICGMARTRVTQPLPLNEENRPAITVVLSLPDGDVPVPGGKVTVLTHGWPNRSGEVRRVNPKTVTVRFYNPDRSWWEGLFSPSRLRAGVSEMTPPVPLNEEEIAAWEGFIKLYPAQYAHRLGVAFVSALATIRERDSELYKLRRLINEARSWWPDHSDMWVPTMNPSQPFLDAMDAEGLPKVTRRAAVRPLDGPPK